MLRTTLCAAFAVAGLLVGLGNLPGGANAGEAYAQNVDHKGTRAAAEAYLKFLYTDEAQEIIAKHYYRPINEEILNKHRETFPEIRFFAITDIGENWDDIHQKLVGDGSVFDTVYKPR